MSAANVIDELTTYEASDTFLATGNDVGSDAPIGSSVLTFGGEESSDVRGMEHLSETSGKSGFDTQPRIMEFSSPRTDRTEMALVVAETSLDAAEANYALTQRGMEVQYLERQLASRDEHIAILERDRDDLKIRAGICDAATEQVAALEQELSLRDEYIKELEQDRDGLKTPTNELANLRELLANREARITELEWEKDDCRLEQQAAEKKENESCARLLEAERKNAKLEREIAMFREFMAQKDMKIAQLLTSQASETCSTAAEAPVFSDLRLEGYSHIDEDHSTMLGTPPCEDIFEVQSAQDAIDFGKLHTAQATPTPMPSETSLTQKFVEVKRGVGISPLRGRSPIRAAMEAASAPAEPCHTYQDVWHSPHRAVKVSASLVRSQRELAAGTTSLYMPVEPPCADRGVSPWRAALREVSPVRDVSPARDFAPSPFFNHAAPLNWSQDVPQPSTRESLPQELPQAQQSWVHDPASVQAWMRGASPVRMISPLCTTGRELSATVRPWSWAPSDGSQCPQAPNCGESLSSSSSSPMLNRANLAPPSSAAPASWNDAVAVATAAMERQRQRQTAPQLNRNRNRSTGRKAEKEQPRSLVDELGRELSAMGAVCAEKVQELFK